MSSSSSTSSSSTRNLMTSTTTTTTTTTVNISNNTGGMQVPTPEHFICSISGEIFKDPVIAADGQTYERESIEKWIATKEGQPVTLQWIKQKLLNGIQKQQNKEIR